MKDYYRILEVSPDATPEVIKAAYRAIAVKNPNNNAILKAINEAYDLLSDSVKKEDYDKARKKKPKTIGSYKLVKEIASGGFGTTYLGEHLLLGTPVCIKHADNVSPQDEEIMCEEAKAMWDLRHWAIPSLREIVKLEDESLAIIMSYIPGPTLEQLLAEYQKRKEPFEAEHVCWIIERVLNALRYLHSHGVVHGDVKPQNIIIHHSTHQVALVDYGLSLVRPKHNTVNKGYTPYYASPEQEKGMPLLPEADMYSLGMTMIYAFGGDITSKSVPDGVHDEICKFIKRLIKFNPLQRPNWATEDLCKTISDLRQTVFGRRASDMKPLKV